jgi:hypothetical protein
MKSRIREQASRSQVHPRICYLISTTRTTARIKPSIALIALFAHRAEDVHLASRVSVDPAPVAQNAKTSSFCVNVQRIARRSRCLDRIESGCGCGTVMGFDPNPGT